MSIEELEKVIKDRQQEIEKVEMDTKSLEEAYANKGVTQEEYDNYKIKNSELVAKLTKEMDEAKRTINAYNNIKGNIKSLKKLPQPGNDPYDQAQYKEEYDKRLQEIRNSSKYLNDELRKEINTLINNINEVEEKVEESVIENKAPKSNDLLTNDQYLTKLRNVGRVFTDEERIDENHRYLSEENAYNLGYLNLEKIEEDSLSKPTPISRFANIKEKLWKKIENFRNRNKNINKLDEMEEIDIDFNDIEEEPIKSESVLGEDEIVGYVDHDISIKYDDLEKTAEQMVEEMATPSNIVEFEQEKVRTKMLDKSGFISLSIMAITTTVVSLSIVALGLMVLN